MGRARGGSREQMSRRQLEMHVLVFSGKAAAVEAAAAHKRSAWRRIHSKNLGDLACCLLCGRFLSEASLEWPSNLTWGKTKVFYFWDFSWWSCMCWEWTEEDYHWLLIDVQRKWRKFVLLSLAPLRYLPIKYDQTLFMVLLKNQLCWLLQHFWHVMSSISVALWLYHTNVDLHRLVSHCLCFVWLCRVEFVCVSACSGKDIAYWTHCL